MVDTITAEARSRNMSQIRSKNTRPEMLVRRLLFSAGYRYRLYANDLPGKPDIVFRSRRKVVFVHGCFWHLHAHCKLTRVPNSHTAYWTSKLEANRARDERTVALLRDKGWDVLLVWECEIKDLAALLSRLKAFLGPPGPVHPPEVK